MTSSTIDERFAQHRSGYNANRYAREYGLYLLRKRCRSGWTGRRPIAKRCCSRCGCGGRGGRCGRVIDSVPRRRCRHPRQRCVIGVRWWRHSTWNDLIAAAGVYAGDGGGSARLFSAGRWWYRAPDKRLTLRRGSMPKPTIQISEDQYRKEFAGGKGQAAFSQALDIRKFEIELYWTRAAYFWAFITVALAGFGAVLTLDDQQRRADLSVFLSCIGFFVSFCWYCANRGSKQWQENWENHVDLLEDAVTGPLYKVVIVRPEKDAVELDGNSADAWLIRHLTGPFPFSVSKINQIISVYVTLVWLMLVAYSLANGWPRLTVWYAWSVLLAGTAAIIVWKWARTHTSGFENIATLRHSALSPPSQEEPPRI